MVVKLNIPEYRVSAAASSPEASSNAAMKLQTDSAKNQTLRNGMAGGGDIPTPMAASTGAPGSGCKQCPSKYGWCYERTIGRTSR